ncbi:MAG: 2-oxo acid dehydrogenase subunit E2 [Candidatus Niyogibacteria bacterium]|nr:2-oxo acid dehydrogenase subunit E2 [Candidatus Niyogibacteria bacterium]
MKKYLEISEKGFGARMGGGYTGGDPLAGVSVMTIEEWYVKVGDTIPGTENPDTGYKTGGRILYVTSDKGAVELTALSDEVGAVLSEILIPAGKEVEIDFRNGPIRLAVLEVAGEEPAIDMSPEKAEVSKAPETVRVSSFAEAMMREQVRHALATPYARKLAKGLGIDIQELKGSGAGGKVMERDIRAEELRRANAALPKPEPAPSAIPAREILIIKPSFRRRATALYLSEAAKAPLAGDSIEVAMLPLEDLRNDMREEFERLHETVLRFDHFVGAACRWLLQRREFRILNAYWRESEKDIAVYPYVNLGFAVGIPPRETKNVEIPQSELAVMPVKNAEQMGFAAFAREANRLMEAVRTGTAAPADYIGTTFTVNNVGSRVEWKGKRYPGGENPFSILVPKTAAIVSFGSIREPDSARIATLAIRFDHRVCDGLEPITFLRALEDLLEHPVQILAL